MLTVTLDAIVEGFSATLRSCTALPYQHKLEKGFEANIRDSKSLVINHAKTV